MVLLISLLAGAAVFVLARWLIVERAPVMAGQWLTANLLVETGLSEVAVVGNLNAADTQSLLAVIGSSFRPTLVVGARQTGAESLLSILQDREPPPGSQAAAWVCRGSACAAPTSDPMELAGLLARG